MEWDVLKNIAATLGPGASLLLLYFLYQENKERREKDRQLLNLSTAGTKALTGASASIDAAEKAIAALRSEVRAEGKSTRKALYEVKDKVLAKTAKRGGR